MVRGRLAKLRGDLKGNPFKAVVDLIDHEKLQMKHGISLGAWLRRCCLSNFW
jgi:hypothetical protein